MAAHDSDCAQCGASLPPAARFCPACGARAETAATAVPPAAPAGERRQVAILFADLAGYTRLSSALDAEDVHDLLTRYFALADGAIQRMGGAVDKHVGDAVMGVFGAPVAHGNDAERALRAALEIHAGMAAIAPAGAAPLAAHIGVACGEVVAAATGSDVHRTYTVTGDAVNLAARLTDLAKAGETVVSDDARRLVGAMADVDPLGELPIRGLAAPQRVWKLRALRAPAAARLPLVGRAAERRRFAALFADVVATRRGAVALISGEPGLGKSRLAETFVAHALGEGALTHTATILDFGAARGEDAVHALACSLLDAPAHGSDELRREALANAIAQGRAAPGDEAFLADLLLLPPAPGSGYEALDDDARRSGKLGALVDVVGRTAARAPCALLVEDVHWASGWVAACLHALAGVAASAPVLLLATTRREGALFAADWGATRVERFDLAPLAVDDALALARLHYATSADIAARCVSRAQGNPLFLVQLLRDGADDAAIPASIQSVVLSRLDRLDPADKRALQAAAVIGQHFGLDALRALVGDRGYVPRAPIERDLVRELVDEAGVYAFAHALIRDGAYASLLHSARRDLHRAAAAWYADRDPTLHAQHLDRADDGGAAAAYLEAARVESEALRPDAAVALARRGAELASGAPLRHALAMLEGRLQVVLGHADLGADAFARALAAATTDAERCAAQLGIAGCHRLTSAIEPGLAALDAAQALAGAAPRELAHVHYLRGAFRFAQGDAAACQSEHERALALAAQAGDTEREVQAQSGLADALYAQGRMPSARAAFARCVELAQGAATSGSTLANRCMLGFIDAYLGEPDRALAELAQARADALVVRNRFAETMSYECEGYALIMCGRYAAARPVLDKALEMSRAIGARRFEVFVLHNLARLRRSEGDAAGALACARHAWERAAEIAPRFAGPILLGGIAAATADPLERARALAEGERLLAQGCVAHCHFDFYPCAIDLALEDRAWDEALRYAAALEAFSRAEPFALTQFTVMRARALVDAARGRPDRTALIAARELGAARQFRTGLPALDAALAALA